LDFPPAFLKSKVAIMAEGLVFSTPFGHSPPFKLLRLADGRLLLSCLMHGWRPGISRRSASQQIFWVFREAGVRRVVAEGGVGSIREHYTPGDIVIPDDYIDWSCRRDTCLGDGYLLIMRDPLCPEIRGSLASSARRTLSSGRVIEGGVYAVTDGRHFESRAEVRALGILGADVIGQSLAPEVYLAREIGACYAGVHQVVNRAEGVGDDWSHEELADIFTRRAPTVAEILVEACLSLPASESCHCRELRKETLLRMPPPPRR